MIFEYCINEGVRNISRNADNYRDVGSFLRRIIMKRDAIGPVGTLHVVVKDQMLDLTPSSGTWDLRGIIFMRCEFIIPSHVTIIKNATTFQNCKIVESAAPSAVKCKIVKLPNPNFVKTIFECDFCHHKFEYIQRANGIENKLKTVPLANDKFVCDKCYNVYELSNKRPGNRTYGYHGPVSCLKTPMDKHNTEILGLEMEFEGKFNKWKELEDAHQGKAFFGYDSSVVDENELSWDCGSYSYWKHLMPLKQVCDVLKSGGATEGNSAGIHIHISRPDMDNRKMADKILDIVRRNKDLTTALWAISLRSDKSKCEQYCSINAESDAHHAAIARGRRTDTVEFRVFSCSLDNNIIIKRLKFCKEIYSLIAERTPSERILPALSKTIKKHLEECGKIQVKKGFITEADYQSMMKNMLSK